MTKKKKEKEERDLTCKKAYQDKPGRPDLLPGGVIMHHTPDTRLLILPFLLACLFVCPRRAEQLLQVRGHGLPVLPTLLFQQCRIFIDLIIPPRQQRRRIDAVVVQGLVNLLNHLADGLVRLFGQEEYLYENDDYRYDEVKEEEPVVAKGAARLLEDEAVNQEQGAGGVKCAGQEGKDQTRVAREGVGQLEGRDVGKRAAEGEEEVAEEQAVEGNGLLVGHKQGPDDEEERAQDAADARAKVVQDSTDWEGGDVGAHGGDGEHEVEVNLDAGIHIV